MLPEGLRRQPKARSPASLRQGASQTFFQQIYVFYPKLAFEAELRDIRIGELIGALIAATMEKDLLQLILDTEKGTKTPQTVDLREIRISPNK